MLFLLKENFLDELPVWQVHAFAIQFVSYVKSVYEDTYNVILKTGDISEEIEDVLRDIAGEFSKLFVPPSQ